MEITKNDCGDFKGVRNYAKKRERNRKQESMKEVRTAQQNINSSRVKTKSIGKTFSRKRKSIRQAVTLGGSSKWIRLRECVQ